MNDTAPNAGTPPPGPIPTQDERSWAMIAHLAAFAGFVLPLVGNMLGPLVVWLTRRDQSAFVASQAKESLNFNISVALGAVVCWMLIYVLIGILLGVMLFFSWLALTLIAAIKASEGVDYRYPVSLRLIK